MELRAFADQILRSTHLEEKLYWPTQDDWTDDDPGPETRVELPARADQQRFTSSRRAARMPKPVSFSRPECRAVSHHIMANHELQALEVMAWVLQAFPQAPKEFRLGLLRVMKDEQRHTRLHLKRLQALGFDFGDFKLNGYVWKRNMHARHLLDYLACLPLTFEQGNLDHSLEFEQLYNQFDDRKSAQVMHAIHHDEIDHVRFGLIWLRKFKNPDETDWTTYWNHLTFPMRPAYGKGQEIFDDQGRQDAGFDQDFLEHMKRCENDWINQPESYQS